MFEVLKYFNNILSVFIFFNFQFVSSSQTFRYDFKQYPMVIQNRVKLVMFNFKTDYKYTPTFLLKIAPPPLKRVFVDEFIFTNSTNSNGLQGRNQIKIICIMNKYLLFSPKIWRPLKSPTPMDSNGLLW